MDSAVVRKAAEPSFYAPSPAAVTAYRRPYIIQGKGFQRYNDDSSPSDESDREHEDVADTANRRRAARDSIVSHGDGVLGAPKRLSQLLSLLENGVSTVGAARLARWGAREDDEAVYLKVLMPGLGKEHMKVRAEKNILVIKGEGEKGDDDSAEPTYKYNRRIEMPADAYKMDKVKAEIKNGVLSLTVPKLKDGGTQTGLSFTARASRLASWVAKEDEDAVYLKVPMPGLAKEHVKVCAEKNILLIKGEGDKDDYDSPVPRYNGRIKMPAYAYKMDQIKGEMKNGLLWLTVLKVKQEERNDVFQVKIQ